MAPVAQERAAVIVSNPPYISPREGGALPASVREWEPHLALFATDDGMAVIDSVASGAAEVLLPGGLLAMEVDARRAGRALASVIATGRFAGAEVVLDLAGRERFVVARRA